MAKKLFERKYDTRRRRRSFIIFSSCNRLTICYCFREEPAGRLFHDVSPRHDNFVAVYPTLGIVVINGRREKTKLIEKTREKQT